MNFWPSAYHRPLLSSTRAKLASHYSVKNLGPIKHLLGWKVDHIPTSLSIKQLAFIFDVLKRFNMDTCTPSLTPYDTIVISARKPDEAKLPSPLFTPLLSAASALSPTARSPTWPSSRTSSADNPTSYANETGMLFR